MDVRLPDGTVVKNVPEGTTKAQLMAMLPPERFAAIKAEGNVQKPPTPFRPSGETALSPGEEILANPYGRAAVGMAKPFLGAGQLALNAVGQGEGINREMANLRDATAKAREYVGSRGVDLADMTGQAATMALPAGMMGNAATTAGRIGQGALLGGATGLTTPVEDAQDTGDFFGKKAVQTAAGAALGAAVPGAWELAKAGGRGVRNVVQPYMGEWGADRAAGRLGNAMAKEKDKAIVAALRRNEEIVPGSAPNAGQAAADVGSAEFSAFQKIADSRNPSATIARQRAQDQARIAALRNVARTPDELAAQRTLRAENAAENYGSIMGDMVTPDSQVGAMEKAIAGRAAAKAEALRDQGRFGTMAAQQENLAHGGLSPQGNTAPTAVPVPGMPRIPGRYTENIERVAPAQAAAAEAGSVAATRRAEEEYLRQTMETLKDTVGLENKSLYDFLSRPSVQQGLKDAAKSASEKGAYFPEKAGDNFTVGNLQRIKEALDDAVRDPASFGIKATEAKEIGDTRAAFVKWLSNKKPEWEKARLQYRQDSIPIDQMEVGQFLEGRLKDTLRDEGKLTPKMYATALRDSDSLLKKATGQDRPMREYMRPDQMENLRSITRDMGRDANMDALAQAGSPEAHRILNIAVPELAPTGMFNPTISFGRGLYNRLTGHATDRILMDASKRMATPEKFADMMENARPFPRQALVDALMRYQAPGVVEGVSAVNEGVE